jgi:hypothetical protein
MATQSERHGPRGAPLGAGLEPLPYQPQQQKAGKTEPPAEPWDCRFTKKSGFPREKQQLPSKRNTPTGNAACLGIGRHLLASNAWSFPPCSRCPSLHLAGSDSRRSIEPSAEPSAQTSTKWPQNRPPSGEPPKPLGLLSYLCSTFFSYVYYEPQPGRPENARMKIDGILTLFYCL